MFNAIQGLNHRILHCLSKSFPKSTMREPCEYSLLRGCLDPSFVLFAISTTFPTASNNLSYSFSWDTQAIHLSIFRCLYHRHCLHWALFGDFQVPFVHSFFPPFIHVFKCFELDTMQWGKHSKMVKIITIPSLLPSDITIYCEIIKG